MWSIKSNGSIQYKMTCTQNALKAYPILASYADVLSDKPKNICMGG